jgi:hypothetical protein
LVSWLRLFVLFLSPSRRMPWYYFKITPRQFPIILYNSLITLPSILYNLQLGDQELATARNAWRNS